MDVTCGRCGVAAPDWEMRFFVFRVQFVSVANVNAKTFCRVCSDLIVEAAIDAARPNPPAGGRPCPGWVAPLPTHHPDSCRRCAGRKEDHHDETS